MELPENVAEISQSMKDCLKSQQSRKARIARQKRTDRKANWSQRFVGKDRNARTRRMCQQTGLSDITGVTKLCGIDPIADLERDEMMRVPAATFAGVQVIAAKLFENPDYPRQVVQQYGSLEAGAFEIGVDFLRAHNERKKIEKKKMGAKAPK